MPLLLLRETSGWQSHRDSGKQQEKNKMRRIMRSGVKGNFRKDPPVVGLNSCHANKWAIETAGYPLITAMEVIYANLFPCSLAGQG